MIITKKYIDTRLEKLILHMNQNNIDVTIISSPENTFYYSHFNPIIYSHPVFIIVKKSGETSLLVHALRYLHAQKESLVDNIYLYGKWGDHSSIALDYHNAIKIIIHSDSSLNFALEKNYISINFLEKLYNDFKISQIHDISSFISRKKIIKDSYEISCIKKACFLSDIGVETTIKYLKKGYSEADACTEGQYIMRKEWQQLFSKYEISGFGTSEGGQIDALFTWCLSNEQISYGCDCPTDYIPKNGDLILPQAWAKINCYSGECKEVFL
ncbi:aminopeptidase P family N-terminal domain-containing protein [Fusobacterium sp. PH5-44]|uniref:aminopeptidase P family N-terminal domain-containing protein n=1 Tax=unclassified Fusobacterium TaxID=2648384 RepID=UPI003D250E75